MFIGTVVISLHASWVRSLKQKRGEVKRLIERTRNKFNVSICELDSLDVHKTIVLGIGCVANSKAYLDSALEEVLNFIEKNTSAEVFDIEYEVF